MVVGDVADNIDVILYLLSGMMSDLYVRFNQMNTYIKDHPHQKIRIFVL